MSRKTKIVIAVVGLLAIGGIAAALAFGVGSSQVQVEVAQAQQQDLAVTVMTSGVIDSGARADVFPSTSGLLAEVLVKDGATVKAGAVLARLDTAPLDVQVSAARAGLAQAEAGLATINDSEPTSEDAAAAHHAANAAWSGYKAALTGIDAAADAGPTSGDLAAASAATNAAWRAYDAARAAYDLLEASIEASAMPSPVATAELTSAGIARDQAYAAYLGAKATESKLEGYDSTSATAQARAGADSAYAAFVQARSAQAKLEAADSSSQRSAAQAAIDQARLALTIAEENRANAELLAPIDGVVLFNALGTPAADGQYPKAAVGAAAAPGAAPFTIVNMGGLRFTAEVDEVDIDVIDVGMTAKIALDAFSEPFDAQVAEVRPAATLTATGGTVFPVYLSIDAAEADVLIGMKGDATIEVDSVPDAVTVPIEALFDEGGETFVYKVVSGKLERTPIEIGTMTDTDVEVVSGVKGGDTVALSGPDELVDGMKVEVKS